MKKILTALFSICFLIACKKDPPEMAPVPSVPIVQTYPITNLTEFSATFTGKLVDSGASLITETGILVDTVPLPTINRSLNKFVKPLQADGTFSSSVVMIPPDTKWYVRAYAINAQGVGYGEDVTFNSAPEKVYPDNLVLTSNQEIIDFAAHHYTRIFASLRISGSAVTDLSPLKDLVVIGNGLEIVGTNITNFHGLEKLEMVGFAFPHGMRVENNPLLKDFTGLGRLKIVTGYFYILNNDAQETMAGLNQFANCIGGDFIIKDCDNLKNINGLEFMSGVYGDIGVYNNPKLTDLHAWANLDTVQSWIMIHNCNVLTDINGFQKLRNLKRIDISGNPLLNEMSGLRNAVSIDDIMLTNCPSIKNLNVLSNIVSTNYLQLINTGVSNLSGLTNLRSCRGITISENTSFTNFTGMPPFQQLDGLTITDNPSLLNLNGLENLKKITTWAAITGNRVLQNLDGLSSLTTLNARLLVSSNSALSNFCGLKPLFLAGFNNDFYVEANAVNPTISQVLASCP